MNIARRQMTRTLSQSITEAAANVASAAASFEARWTRRALRKFAPELCDRLEAELQRFSAVMEGGTQSEIDQHGQALVRGYGIIAAKMTAAKLADDAYLIGCDPETGKVIAIGEHPCSAVRVQEVYGKVPWFTPDEIAMLLAKMDAATKIAAVKTAFPGAEIADWRGDDEA